MAAEIVKKLRDLNAMGLVIPPELDKEDSEVNLVVQVKLVQAILQEQSQRLAGYIELLKNTERKNLNEVVKKILTEANPIKEGNDELLEIPLVAIAYSYLADSVSEIAITPLDDKKLKIPAGVVAGWLVTPGKVESDLRSQQEVLDRLSMLSGLVDPDTVGR